MNLKTPALLLTLACAGFMSQAHADCAANATIAALDTDQNVQTPSKFGVRGLPTVMLFKNGQVVGQKTGLARKSDLVALIDKGIG